MNILISSDLNYLDKYEAMLSSLRNHVSQEISVFFLNYRVPSINMNSFINSMKKIFDISVFEIDVRQLEFGGFPIGYHLSIETYFRILAQFILPNNIERILWLDADIIILKDISDFYEQSFDGMKYVVCEERINKMMRGKELKEKLGLPESHRYFNAGVMLMNLEKLRSQTDAKDLMNKCNELKYKVEWYDQDILNIIYCNQVKYNDENQFNYQVRYDKTIPKEKLREIYILHYNAQKKPWVYDSINDISIFYWKAKARCGKVEKMESKTTYKSKIFDSIHDLVIYIKGYFSL